MGLFDDDDLELDALLDSVKKYPSCVLELNEGEVQAIFNRCLAKPDSKETVSSVLFSMALGFSSKDARIIRFDKEALLANKKNIEYLYGQLDIAHKDRRNTKLPIADFVLLYNRGFWTKDADTLFWFLYLGVTVEIGLINPVLAKDKTTALRKNISPTLSPKDPAFPAWWEAHKAEWED